MDIKQFAGVWSADQNSSPWESPKERISENGLSMYCQINYMLNVNNVVQMTIKSLQAI